MGENRKKPEETEEIEEDDASAEDYPKTIGAAPEVEEPELENAREASDNKLTLTLPNMGDSEKGSSRGQSVTMDIPYGVTCTCSNTADGIIIKIHKEEKGTKEAEPVSYTHLTLPTKRIV